MGQVAEDAEYTDCFSAKGLDSSNECSGYSTKQSDGKALLMLEPWRNAECLFIAIAPWFTQAGVEAPDWVLSIGQIELNCVLMLN